MKTITLTTYANIEDSDEYIKEFIISDATFKKLIKEELWNSKREFLDEYTWDNSEVIYNLAKSKNLIISEKIFKETD
jgi:hypothetical protein